VDLLGTKNMPYVGVPVVPAVPTGDSKPGQ
jgi:hypothetical protein